MKNDLLQNEKLFKALTELGLSKTEILVYLNTLRLGSIPASVLSRRIGLNRSTTRYTLENLVKKKLLLQSDKNGTFYFVAEDPEQIVQSFKTQRAALEEKEQLASRIVGDLKSIKNPNSKLPKVQYFEGFEDSKKSYEAVIDELTPSSELLAYVNPIQDFELQMSATKVMQAFVDKRIEHKIPIKILAFADSVKHYMTSEEAEFRETRFINESYGMFGFASETLIYDDVIFSIYATPEGLFSYKVTHPEQAQFQRALFKALWKRTD